MKRILLTAALALLALPTSGDEIVRWPDGRRVYVVDIQNLGFGRIQKPAGIDVLVLRDGKRWGVIPPSVYAPKSPAPARASGGWLGSPRTGWLD